jgi:hypothetical protein
MDRIHVALTLLRSVILALLGFMTALTAAESTQLPKNAPSLNDTLQWLNGASEAESGDGNHLTTFDNDGRDHCSATITETRDNAGPNFWIKMSFSLADIDPNDIQADDLNLKELKFTIAADGTTSSVGLSGTTQRAPNTSRPWKWVLLPPETQDFRGHRRLPKNRVNPPAEAVTSAGL